MSEEEDELIKQSFQISCSNQEQLIIDLKEINNSCSCVTAVAMVQFGQIEISILKIHFLSYSKAIFIKAQLLETNNLKNNLLFRKFEKSMF